jgi:hypothetical protein
MFISLVGTKPMICIEIRNDDKVISIIFSELVKNKLWIILKLCLLYISLVDAQVCSLVY